MSGKTELKRLGVFGGTFDPPHIAHLILAAEALHQLDLDRVLWVLTPVPPHKPGRPITVLKHRLRMLEAALEGEPDFVLSKVDVNRPPPHFAVDTIDLLREEFPRSNLIYLIGGDSLVELPTWHEPEKLVAACDSFGVLERPGESIDMDSLEEQLPGLQAKVDFITAPLISVSSSDIRRRIREDQHYKFYVPEKVHQVIEELRLYRHEIQGV